MNPFSEDSILHGATGNDVNGSVLASKRFISGRPPRPTRQPSVHFLSTQRWQRLPARQGASVICSQCLFSFSGQPASFLESCMERQHRKSPRYIQRLSTIPFLSSGVSASIKPRAKTRPGVERRWQHVLGCVKLPFGSAATHVRFRELALPNYFYPGFQR